MKDRLEVEDTRRNYGEPRIICYGYLDKRLVVVDYTPRGDEGVKGPGSISLRL